MKLPAFIEDIFVKLVISKSGPAIQKAISAIVAGVVGFASTKLPGSETFLTPTVVGGLTWALVDYLITLVPGHILSKYGKELQQVLDDAGANVKVDGFVGRQTVKSAIAVTSEKE